jgi:hypothetical protein
MPLLTEYALIPDIFDSTSYTNDEVGDIRLQYLKEVLLAEGLVRNLRDGNWFKLFANNGRPWHRRGKELLNKLERQNRLRRCNPSIPREPSTDCEWCDEALASHEISPLSGIVTTRAVADLDPYCKNSNVASIDHLPITPWWANRSPSVRLHRTIAEYRQHLELVLSCANSLMFIDPHIDPTLDRYRDFISLLLATAGRDPAPLIEIHRVCYIDKGRDRNIIREQEWRDCFSCEWSSVLETRRLSVEVFIWDDFHDRHLISDIMGIELSNGFDTSKKANDMTTWGRLGRKDRDDIQREFDRTSTRHVLRSQFRIPE